MSTYYGFNEREKLKPIDWNSITRDINQKIDTEIERRDTLKADVEEFGREYRKKLNQAPMGDSDTINNWVTEAAGQLGDNFKMIDDQLKSGRLKYKDYIRLRANMNEGVDTMISLAGRANEIYSDKFERMELDESSVLEQVLMDKTIALADFANSAPVIDPDTGNFSLVRRDKNGNIIPGDIISFTNYRNMSSWKGNKFDVNEFADEKVEDLVAKARYQEDLGGVIDIREADGYDAWLTDTANSLNDYQKAEILARAKGYELTDDRSLRDSNDKKYVLYELKQGRPVVDFTGDQQTDADRAVKDAIDVRLSRIYGTPGKTTTGSGTSKDKQDDLLALKVLYSGTNMEEVKSAAQQVLEAAGRIPVQARDLKISIENKAGETFNPNDDQVSDRTLKFSYETDKGTISGESPLTLQGVGLLGVKALNMPAEEAMKVIGEEEASESVMETSYGYTRLDDYNNQSKKRFTADGLSTALSAEFYGSREPEGFGIETSAGKVVIKKKLGKGFATITLSPRNKIDQDLLNKWENLRLEDLGRKDKAALDDEKVLDFTEMLREEKVEPGQDVFKGLGGQMTVDAMGGAQVGKFEYLDYSNTNLSPETRDAITLLQAANLNPESLKNPLATDDIFLAVAQAIHTPIPEGLSVEDVANSLANTYGEDDDTKRIIRTAINEYHK
jgi:hypothetical protein